VAKHGWPKPKRGSLPTPDQAALLAFMKRHLAEHQRLPSHREMEREFDSRGVHGVLQGLVTRGLVKPAKGRPRAYRLVGVRVLLLETP
jgi:SOS-response transcriptional repressor LexA